MTVSRVEDLQPYSLLVALTAVMIEPAGSLPAPTAIEGFADLIRVAVKAACISEEELSAAVEQLPDRLDIASVRRFAEQSPTEFETLSVICAGAYTMAPVVLRSLGFPADRQNPAGQMDAADEYETGILEPVLNLGRSFCDPRLKQSTEGSEDQK